MPPDDANTDLRVNADLLGQESEADLVEWLVADGQAVAEGEAVAELSTAKVVMQLLAPAAGRLRQLSRPGDLVTLETVLGVIEPV